MLCCAADDHSKSSGAAARQADSADSGGLCSSRVPKVNGVAVAVAFLDNDSPAAPGVPSRRARGAAVNLCSACRARSAPDRALVVTRCRVQGIASPRHVAAHIRAGADSADSDVVRSSRVPKLNAPAQTALQSGTVPGAAHREAIS